MKIKAIRSLLVVMVLVLGMVLYLGLQATLADDAVTGIEMLDKTPAVPKNVLVYKTKPVRLGPDEVKELAQGLSLSGQGQVADLGDTLVYNEGQFRIEARKQSGALWYLDEKRFLAGGPLDKPTFTEERAVILAEAFLRSSRLMPEDGVYVEQVRHLSDLAISADGKERVSRVVDTEVLFRRTIDGVPVNGPGSIITVYLDNEGQVTGCYKLWREIETEPVGTVKTVGPKSALAQIEANYDRQAQVFIGVEDLQFGYFAQGPGEAQAYLQPAYVAREQATTPDGVTGRFADAVPGSKTMFEPLVHDIHSLSPDSVKDKAGLLQRKSGLGPHGDEEEQ